MFPRVLIVDTNVEFAESLKQSLVEAGYEPTIAASLEEAKTLLSQFKFEAALTELDLPGAVGLDALYRLLSADQHMAVIVQTRRLDTPLIMEAFRQGAADYLQKPYEFCTLISHMRRALWKRRAAIDSLEYSKMLEKLVFERTEQLQHTYRQTILSLTRALDHRDNETYRHTERVLHYSRAIGEQIGLDELGLNSLEWGALLHDVGKIGVPDAILKKPGKLTSKERALIEQHVLYGYEMLKGIPFLEESLNVVRYHHEWYDGSGYPHGLKGEEIPLAARIFAIADVFDALTSDRPYREAMTMEEAVALMERSKGVHFDPELFDAFIKALPTAWQTDQPLDLAA